MKKPSFIIYYERNELSPADNDIIMNESLDSLTVDGLIKENDLETQDSGNLKMKDTSTFSKTNSHTKIQKIKAVQQTGEWHSITREE